MTIKELNSIVDNGSSELDLKDSIENSLSSIKLASENIIKAYSKDKLNRQNMILYCNILNALAMEYRALYGIHVPFYSNTTKFSVDYKLLYSAENSLSLENNEYNKNTDTYTFSYDDIQELHNAVNMKDDETGEFLPQRFFVTDDDSDEIPRVPYGLYKWPGQYLYEGASERFNATEKVIYNFLFNGEVSDTAISPTLKFDEKAPSFRFWPNGEVYDNGDIKALASEDTINDNAEVYKLSKLVKSESDSYSVNGSFPDKSIFKVNFYRRKEGDHYDTEIEFLTSGIVLINNDKNGNGSFKMDLLQVDDENKIIEDTEPTTFIHHYSSKDHWWNWNTTPKTSVCSSYLTMTFQNWSTVDNETPYIIKENYESASKRRRKKRHGDDDDDHKITEKESTERELRAISNYDEVKKDVIIRLAEYCYNVLYYPVYKNYKDVNNSALRNKIDDNSINAQKNLSDVLKYSNELKNCSSNDYLNCLFNFKKAIIGRIYKSFIGKDIPTMELSNENINTFGKKALDEFENTRYTYGNLKGEKMPPKRAIEINKFMSNNKVLYHQIYLFLAARIQKISGTLRTFNNLLNQREYIGSGIDLALMEIDALEQLYVTAKILDKIDATTIKLEINTNYDSLEKFETYFSRKAIVYIVSDEDRINNIDDEDSNPDNDTDNSDVPEGNELFQASILDYKVYRENPGDYSLLTLENYKIPDEDVDDCSILYDMKNDSNGNDISVPITFKVLAGTTLDEFVEIVKNQFTLAKTLDENGKSLISPTASITVSAVDNKNVSIETLVGEGDEIKLGVDKLNNLSTLFLSNIDDSVFNTVNGTQYYNITLNKKVPSSKLEETNVRICAKVN